jgi:sporulation protein YlmC with PRC-barrel domain
MLRSLEDLTGASVMAVDGGIGTVRNCIFDDQSWDIRYLVVDVGSWLARSDVVIALSAVDQPDWDRKTLRVNLTKEQVWNSPDVDSKKPVSRQQEIAMREYFKWPAYWENGGYAEFPAVSIPAGREFPVHTQEDPHLRSAEAVTGYAVWGEDGEVGRLENFILDEASWHIGYLDVKMGDWLHSRSMLVPTRWVMSVSWAHHRVNLCHA